MGISEYFNYDKRLGRRRKKQKKKKKRKKKEKEILILFAEKGFLFNFHSAIEYCIVKFTD